MSKRQPTKKAKKYHQKSTSAKQSSRLSVSRIIQLASQKFIQFVNSTKYLAMIDSDCLHYKHLNKILNSDFQVIIKKMAEDFYYLLLVNDDLFWKQLEQNPSLKYALQSCLTILPRKKYEMYINLIQEAQHKENQQTDYLKNVSFQRYQTLLKYTLFIHYRIVHTANKSRAQLLYDQWIFDMPKLLDLVAIYAPSNPVIVKNIVNKVFQINPGYYDDWNSLLNLLYKNWFNDVFKQLQFQFDNHNKRSNAFKNQKKSFLENLIKTLFKVFEHCAFFNDVFNNFPKKCVYDLGTDEDIIQKNLNIYAKFMQTIRQRWTIQTNDLRRKIYPIYENIRQTFITMFLTYFDILHKIFKDTTATSTQKSNAKQCLVLFSHCLSSAINKKNKYLLELFQICFRQTNPRNIFTLQLGVQLEPQQAASIKSSINYEKLIKKPMIQKLDFIQMAISGIPPFSDWKLTLERLEKENHFKENKQQIKKNLYMPQYDDEPEQEDPKYYRLPNFWEKNNYRRREKKQQAQIQTHETSVLYTKKKKVYTEKNQNKYKNEMTMNMELNQPKRNIENGFDLSEIQNQNITLTENHSFMGQSHFLDLNFVPGNQQIEDFDEFLIQLEKQPNEIMLKRQSKIKKTKEVSVDKNINISMSYFSEQNSQYDKHSLEQISLLSYQKNSQIKNVKEVKKQTKKTKYQLKKDSSAYNKILDNQFGSDNSSDQNLSMTMISQ